MVRTPLGESLREPAARILAGCGALLATARPFVPETYDAAFHLATTDHIAHVLVERVHARLRSSTAGAQIRIHRVPTDATAFLADGGDLVLAPSVGDEPDLLRTHLFTDRFVVIARRGHPALREAWTADRYAQLPHFLVTPQGADARGIVDERLADFGLERRVSITSPTFSSAPWFVAKTDCVATVPERFARSFQPILELEFRAPPIDLPKIPVYMFWHPRVDAEPRHQWLRAQLQSVSATIPDVDSLG